MASELMTGQIAFLVLLFLMAVVGITVAVLAYTYNYTNLETGSTTITPATIPSSAVTLRYPQAFGTTPALVVSAQNRFTGQTCDSSITSSSDASFTTFVSDCPVTGTPVATSSFYRGSIQSMCQVGSYPAIVYAGTDTNPGIFYTIALDVNGLTWRPPVRILDSTTPLGLKMIAVGGVPCVLYSTADAANDILTFKRATDTLWTATDVTQTVAIPPTGYGAYSDMIEEGGAPCVFYSLADGVLTMKRGPTFSTATAVTIYTPSPVAASALKLSAALVNGLPSVAYFIPVDGASQVRFSQASTASGSTWAASQLVSDTNVASHTLNANVTLIALNNLPIVGTVYQTTALITDTVHYTFYKSTASAGTAGTWGTQARLRNGYNVRNVRAVSNGTTAYLSYAYLNGIETVYATAAQMTTEYLAGDNAYKLSYVQNGSSTDSLVALVDSVPAFVYVTSGDLFFFRPSATVSTGFAVTYSAIGYRK